MSTPISSVLITGKQWDEYQAYRAAAQSVTYAENCITACKAAGITNPAATADVMRWCEKIILYETNDEYRNARDREALLATDGEVSFREAAIEQIRVALASLRGER